MVWVFKEERPSATLHRVLTGRLGQPHHAPQLVEEEEKILQAFVCTKTTCLLHVKVG